MLYLLAIVFPPAAVLISGRPVQALLSIVLTILAWVPGVIHAVLIVNEKKADDRMRKQVKLLKKANR